MQSHATIDAYIAAQPPALQVILHQVRAQIRGLLPDASEAISYAMPTYKINGKNIVHFAGYRQHIGIYPGSQVVAELQGELVGYKTSKGAVQLPLTESFPHPLIERIVRVRLTHFLATGK
jgi:uncharacterized protein YdhG (YjbR/CyaY superfamily)